MNTVLSGMRFRTSITEMEAEPREYWRRVNIVLVHINVLNLKERGGDTSHGYWRKRPNHTNVGENRGRNTSDSCRR